MSLVAAAEEDLKAGEHMALADKRFLLQRPDSLVSPDEKAKLKEEVMAGIKENNMSVFYEETCAKLGWEVDQTFLTTMKKANEERLKELAEQLEKAKEFLLERQRDRPPHWLRHMEEIQQAGKAAG